MSMRALSEAVADQALLASDALPEAPLAEVLELRGAIDRMVQTLGMLRSEVDARAVKLMDRSERVVLPGSGVFNRGWVSPSRKAWEHDAILKEVLARILAEPIEPALDVRTVAEIIVARVLQAVTISGWKKGQLEALGIDVDQYCQTSPGHASLERTD